MNKKLSPTTIAIILLLFVALATFAFTSAKVSGFFADLPLGALAGLGTLGGLIVTGLVVFSAKIAIKKRRK